MSRVGVDVGGTFTDVVLLDEESGALHSGKVLSRPDAFDEGVIAGLDKVVGGIEPRPQVTFVGHGTTVVTNATIERTGPRVALLCTEGFRDVLEIARLARPAEKVYDLKHVMPEPIVRRRDRLEVPERVDAQGVATRELDRERVRDAARVLRARGVRSAAVCFLFSYRNPEHEREARAILAEEYPELDISISSEVWPEFREYERWNTTALNAYLRPAAAAYVARLKGRLAEHSPEAQLWVMQSNGGLTHPDVAAQLPVRLVLSGPSGGVIAAQHVAANAGIQNTITMDMGGTSFDVSLLPANQPQRVDEQKVMNLPIKGRSLDILTIGAGGGSIAWVDEGGQFRVGPHSARAMPGPAAYGLGGEDATVTDANVVLGYLGAESAVAGGELSLDSDAATRACEWLGKALGLDAVETAWGIRRIVNAAMAGAVHAASVRKGYDPRDFALLAFGGAGPLHAVDIAREMDIDEVVVPPTPGCFSALGICVTDLIHDLVESHAAVVGDGVDAEVAGAFDELRREGARHLTDAGLPGARHHFVHSLDMRYRGQNSAVNVPASSDASLAETTRSFHELHERLYGYQVPGEPVEIVNVCVQAVGAIGLRAFERNGRTKSRVATPLGTRKMYFGSDRPELAPASVFKRELLTPGDALTGPALVESDDSTVVVPPGVEGRVDELGNLRLRVRPR